MDIIISFSMVDGYGYKLLGSVQTYVPPSLSVQKEGSIKADTSYG